MQSQLSIMMINTNIDDNEPCQNHHLPSYHIPLAHRHLLYRSNRAAQNILFSGRKKSVEVFSASKRSKPFIFKKLTKAKRVV